MATKMVRSSAAPAMPPDDPGVLGGTGVGPPMGGGSMMTPPARPVAMRPPARKAAVVKRSGKGKKR